MNIKHAFFAVIACTLLCAAMWVWPLAGQLFLLMSGLPIALIAMRYGGKSAALCVLLTALVLVAVPAGVGGAVQLRTALVFAVAFGLPMVLLGHLKLLAVPNAAGEPRFVPFSTVLLFNAGLLFVFYGLLTMGVVWLGNTTLYALLQSIYAEPAAVMYAGMATHDTFTEQMLLDLLVRMVPPATLTTLFAVHTATLLAAAAALRRRSLCPRPAPLVADIVFPKRLGLLLLALLAVKLLLNLLLPAQPLLLLDGALWLCVLLLAVQGFSWVHMLLQNRVPRSVHIAVYVLLVFALPFAFFAFLFIFCLLGAADQFMDMRQRVK